MTVAIIEDRVTVESLQSKLAAVRECVEEWIEANDMFIGFYESIDPEGNVTAAAGLAIHKGNAIMLEDILSEVNK